MAPWHLFFPMCHQSSAYHYQSCFSFREVMQDKAPFFVAILSEQSIITSSTKLSEKRFPKSIRTNAPFKTTHKKSGEQCPLMSIDVLMTNCLQHFMSFLCFSETICFSIFGVGTWVCLKVIRKLSWLLVAPQLCKTPMWVNIYIYKFLGSCVLDIQWQQIYM